MAGATSYQVDVVQPAGTGTVTVLPTSGLTQTVNGLTGGSEYSFTVTASDGTRMTDPSSAVKATPTVVTARVIISTASGRTATPASAARPTPPLTPARSASTRPPPPAPPIPVPPCFGPVGQPLTAAVAPATGSTFNPRYRTTAVTGATNPGAIVAVLTDPAGGVLGTSAPFTLLTNG